MSDHDGKIQNYFGCALATDRKCMHAVVCGSCHTVSEDKKKKVLETWLKCNQSAESDDFLLSESVCLSRL